MARVVIAEDDPKQAELLRRYAAADGHDVILVPDGRGALDELRRRRPDLLVLDVMMPRLNGLDVCRIVRTTPELERIPILMVTGRSGENDLIDGLELGADDYLAKPFSPRELMARARALLRRHRRELDPDDERILEVGDLTVDPRTHAVRWRGTVVATTPAEFELLEALAAEPGRVFTRERLLRQLHGSDPYVSRRTVDVHVANLRKKIDPDLFRTVYGIGYSIPAPG